MGHPWQVNSWSTDQFYVAGSDLRRTQMLSWSRNTVKISIFCIVTSHSLAEIVSKFLPHYSTLHNTKQQYSQAMPKEYQVPPTTESENNAKYT